MNVRTMLAICLLICLFSVFTVLCKAMGPLHYGWSGMKKEMGLPLLYQPQYTHRSTLSIGFFGFWVSEWLHHLHTGWIFLYLYRPQLQWYLPRCQMQTCKTDQMICAHYYAKMYM